MSTAEATAAVQPGRSPRRIATRHGWTIGVCALFAVLLVVEANSAPAFTSFDFQSLVIAALPLAFAAMGQAVVVISGGIDLSIGAQMALTNCIAAKLMQGHGMGTALAICVVVLVVGLAIGGLTGAAVVASGVPDIVVTLATSFVWSGAALLVLKTPGGGSPTDFQNLTTLAGIWEWFPNGLVILAVALLAVWVPLRRTPAGLAIYAVGSDREAAYLSGVRVGATRILAYALGGLFAAAGGLALTSTTGIGSPLSGDLYTLNSVAAIVLGGVALVGGKGGLLGPVVAAFVVTIVVAILVFWGVDSNYGQVIQGGLMVLVVMIGGLLLQRRRA
jgi:ribose transport system permease protein